MGAGPVTLARGPSQATLVSHAGQAWEVQWTAGGGKGFGILNRGVPLQVALNPNEPTEFFYRALGAGGDWRPVNEPDAQ